jgi:hypothetical protein
MICEADAASGTHVRRNADFNGNLALDKDGHQLRVMDSGKAVANPFGSDIEGSPDTLRANRFPGMGGKMKPSVTRFSVELAEGGCAGVSFVTPDADSDDRRVVSPHFCCFAEDPRRRFGSELADGVEDPVARDAEVGLCPQAAAFHPGKQRPYFAPSPVIDHSDGNIYLGVDDALPGESLEHAVGDQFVVLWRAKAFGDRLEREQEPGEVRVIVEGTGLLQGERGTVMAPAQFYQGFRRYCALQVQMQLGFGKAPDEGPLLVGVRRVATHRR